MLVASKVTRSSTKASRITPLRIGQKIHFRIDLSCADGIKTEISVDNSLTVIVVLQEVLIHKGIRLVSTLVVNGTLPSIKSIFIDSVSGTSLDTFIAAFAARGLLASLCLDDLVKGSVGNDSYEILAESVLFGIAHTVDGESSEPCLDGFKLVCECIGKRASRSSHIAADTRKVTNAFESAYNISEEDSTSPEGIEGSQSTPDGEPNQQVTEVKEPPQIEDKEPTKDHQCFLYLLL